MAEQPRYLLLSNMYPSDSHPSHGVFVRNMECELQRRGCQIDHVVIKGRPDTLLGKLVAYSRYTLSAAWKLLRGGHDLTYVHFVSLSAIPVYLCWPLFRGRLVMNAHGSDLLPDTRLKSLVLKLVNPVICRADLLVVPSKYFARLAEARYPSLPVYVSPSAGVDTSVFSPPTEKSQRDQPVHIGFVSRIDPAKGWRTLVDAVALMPGPLRRQVRVTMVGSGSMKPQLEALVAELDLGDVITLAKRATQAELAKYCQAFDVFVFPSHAESLGLVGLEALSCGVPVIASNIPGPREYVQHGVNGWLIETGNAKELLARIEQFIELPYSSREQLARNARDSAMVYDRNTVADGLLAALETVRSAE